jgi:16S rRNA (guanine966-N2)-methyltransferase
MKMRVIGGTLRSKKLCSIKGLKTRPTSGRLREAIFNILSFCFHEAVVLDLFAGTGALGIEALSRGAAKAVFIDHSIDALTVIRKNIIACSLENQADIVRCDIVRGLGCLGSRPAAFDLVFMDPPYDSGMVGPTLCNLRLSGTLGKASLVVVEHSEKEPIRIEDSPEFEMSDQRRYGKTLVSFLNYVV